LSGNHSVDIKQWPSTGWRRVAEGTGAGGGTIKGSFRVSQHNDYFLATNSALQNNYVIGKVSEDHKGILVREANYHPDGGQIFLPKITSHNTEVPLFVLFASLGGQHHQPIKTTLTKICPIPKLRHP